MCLYLYACPAARGGTGAHCGKSRRGLSHLGGHGRRYEVTRAGRHVSCVLPRLVAGATRSIALLQAEQAEHGVE
ncbi:hypothetical protein GCM10010388_62280 [Streptomyces mauvecolor]